MNQMRYPRWLAALGELGGVVIALGLPYVVLAYGNGLSGSAKVGLIILGLLAGSLVAIVSVVVGIAVPSVVTGAGIKLDRTCCTPIETPPADATPE